MRKKTLKNKDDPINKNNSGSINNATATIEEENPKKLNQNGKILCTMN